MAFFTNPPRVYYKHGSTPLCIRELVEQDQRKRFLVVSPMCAINAGITNKVASSISNNGAQYYIHAMLNNECNDTVIDEVLTVAKAFKPDCVVAVGNSAAINVVKFVWDNLSDSCDIRRDPKIYNVAIPTVAGDGAEVTPFATKMVDGKEVTIKAARLVPHMSICDPVWAIELPCAMAPKAGALCAVANSMECLLSKTCNDYVLPFAVGALKLFANHLCEVMAHGGAVRAREHCTNGAMMAGIAVSNIEETGAITCLISTLATTFGVKHGQAAAVVILPLIKKALANATGVVAENLEDSFGTAEKVIALVEKIVADSTLETSRKAFGVEDAVYEAKVAEIAANWNCTCMTAEDVKALLMSC